MHLVEGFDGFEVEAGNVNLHYWIGWLVVVGRQVPACHAAKRFSGRGGRA